MQAPAARPPIPLLKAEQLFCEDDPTDRTVALSDISGIPASGESSNGLKAGACLLPLLEALFY